MGKLRDELVKFGRWLLSDPTDRTLLRMKNSPRYVPGSTNLPGFTVRYVDAPSFASAYEAIFVNGIYDVPSPIGRIVDGGANIGLAVLRWKQLFPDAVIEAYEPDPHVFDVLRSNVEGLPGVRLHRAALSGSTGTARFRSTSSDSGHLDRDGTLEVDTVRLADRLSGVDMVKLDIEGAEADVLSDCAAKLGDVSHLFVEWHSFCDRGQQLDDVISVLSDAGFRLHLQSELASRAPFTHLRTDAGMDNRVNIFAWRPDGTDQHAVPRPAASEDP